MSYVPRIFTEEWTEKDEPDDYQLGRDQAADAILNSPVPTGDDAWSQGVRAAMVEAARLARG